MFIMISMLDLTQMVFQIVMNSKIILQNLITSTPEDDNDNAVQVDRVEDNEELLKENKVIVSTILTLVCILLGRYCSGDSTGWNDSSKFIA